MSTIRESLIQAGVRNLNSFGYSHCNADNILIDEVYSAFFKSMLGEHSGLGKVESLILIEEIESKTSSPEEKTKTSGHAAQHTKQKHMATPAPAKVTPPKGPNKTKKTNAKIAKVATDKARDPAEKIPYNGRVRSFARFLVDSLEDDEDKKTLRAALKEVESLSGLKESAKANGLSVASFDEALEAWFAAGVSKE